ncbi:MAG: VPLPA-CTERM sorting domain-containing protein [Pseudomonadota bacterium]
MIKALAGAALASALLVAHASAVVLNVRIEADGGQFGPTVIDVTIDGAFDALVFDVSDGLTVNTFTPDLGLTVVYDYAPGSDRLTLGARGDASNFASAFTDFRFDIDDLLTSPQVGATFFDSIESSRGAGSPVVSLLSVNEVAAVPLPAAGCLLLAGLGGLGLAARRSSRSRCDGNPT